MAEGYIAGGIRDPGSGIRDFGGRAYLPETMRFSISGIAAMTTSPTTCRLFALTWSRSSCAVCQVGLSRSMMSTAAMPAREELHVVVLDHGQLVERCRCDPGGRPCPR